MIAPQPEYLTASEIAQLCSTKPTEQTVHRWAKRGVLAPDGSRVTLRRKRVGGLFVFTREWLEQFDAKLNGG